MKAKGYATHVALGALGLLAAGFFLPRTFAAQGDAVGDTQMCVALQQIDDRRVIDDKTILLKTAGPAYKRIDLANECPGLKTEGSFSSATSISQLCKQDVLRVNRAAVGSQCVIEQIVTIDEAEARALLASRKK